eukprot:4089255-Prymnesium_polylepis.1
MPNVGAQHRAGVERPRVGKGRKRTWRTERPAVKGDEHELVLLEHGSVEQPPKAVVQDGSVGLACVDPWHFLASLFDDGGAHGFLALQRDAERNIRLVEPVGLGAYADAAVVPLDERHFQERT